MAYSIVNDICASINEEKRNEESIQRLQEVDNMLKKKKVSQFDLDPFFAFINPGNKGLQIVVPGRRLIQEMELPMRAVSLVNKKLNYDCKLFLFSDLLLLVKKNSNSVIYSMFLVQEGGKIG